LVEEAVPHCRLCKVVHGAACRLAVTGKEV
jgi:hypothetical protein